MADVIEGHLQTQVAIERALTNFKKLGKNNWTKAIVQTRIAHLQEQWRRFETGNSRLFAAIKPEDRQKMPYFQANHFATTEEVYLDALAFMNTQLDALTTDKVSQPNSEGDGQACPSVPDTQLPRMKIPQFAGRYETWEAFRNKFTALIIKNTTLHNVTRFHHLVSALEGPALDCISTLSITEDNFKIAWDTLTRRYHNTRRIITAHMSELINLPALSRESAPDLQHLRDRVCVTVESLKKLGRKPEDLWEDFLVYIVSQKLDPPTRKAWKLKLIDDVTPPSFQMFSKFIDSRARGLEEFSSDSDTPSSKRPDTSTRLAARSSRVHAATASHPYNISLSQCPICRASHPFSACPKFTEQSISGRRDLVRKFSRCFNCLSHRHALRDCPSKFSCRVFRKRHHSLLHAAPPPPEPSPSSSLPPEINSHLASTLAAPSSGILLATAWVQLCVPSGRCVTVRALIDQGFEASFVTEAMVHLLRAKRTRVSTSISAVGGVHVGTLRHAVRLHISPRDSTTPSVVTTALVLKSLATYMPKRIHDSQTLSHLSDLTWADADPTSAAAIHVILGADVYCSIYLEGLRKA